MRFIIDDRVAEGPPRGHDPHIGTNQLEGVCVASDDESLQSLSLGLPGKRGQYVVGLIALCGVGGYVECLQQLVDPLELHAEVVGHLGTVGLVLGIVIVPEGASHVKGHCQVLGMLFFQHSEQHRGKPEHGVGELALRCPHRGRQRKIGAVYQRVTVYQYQFVGLCHRFLLLHGPWLRIIKGPAWGATAMLGIIHGKPAPGKQLLRGRIGVHYRRLQTSEVFKTSEVSCSAPTQGRRI